MDKSKSRYFVALLPPLEIQARAEEIKQYFADRYHSRHAKKSPPHITLQPPFEWDTDNVTVLAQCLADFTSRRSSIPITLSGFGAFVPRVIYINVVKTPELLTLQSQLINHLENVLGIVDPLDRKRPFAPHMTVAFKDLTKANFKAAWPEFENRQLQFEFTAQHLTLLLHNGNRWNVKSDFPFLL